MVGCRGSPGSDSQRAGLDRGKHGDVEKQPIQIQQTQGTSLANAGDGGSAVYLVLQSEQIHEGFGSANLVREWNKRLDRSPNRRRIQRGQEGLEVQMTSNGILRHALVKRPIITLTIPEKGLSSHRHFYRNYRTSPTTTDVCLALQQRGQFLCLDGAWCYLLWHMGVLLLHRRVRIFTRCLLYRRRASRPIAFTGIIGHDLCKWLQRRRQRPRDPWPGDNKVLACCKGARPRIVGRPKTRQAALTTSADLRQRVFLKSPVRENRTPGSMRGRSGNRPSYRDGF